jgi:hypothetical protein
VERAMKDFSFSLIRLQNGRQDLTLHPLACLRHAKLPCQKDLGSESHTKPRSPLLLCSDLLLTRRRREKWKGRAELTQTSEQ